MALNITSSITFEEDWLQQDCHWSLNRYFAIRWSVNDSSIDLPSFSYKIKKANGDEKVISPTFADSEQKNNAIVFYRQIDLYSIIDDLPNATKLVAVLAVNDIKNEVSYDLTNFLLKLPPEQSTALAINLVTDNPGEVRCSWSQPTENSDTNNLNEAKGYCIEIFHSKEGEPFFTQLNNIRWNAEKLTDEENQKYYIEKIPEADIPGVTIPEVDGEIATFVFQKPNSELYIENPEVKAFYFMPKELGIKPGDKYLFKVYPYNVYCSHFVYDDESHKICGVATGALLASEGSSLEGKVSKGIVRVKTADSWVDGQVWVCVSDATPEEPNKIKWVQAEAVYAMADDGTGKGVWKEAQ